LPKKRRKLVEREATPSAALPSIPEIRLAQHYEPAICEVKFAGFRDKVEHVGHVATVTLEGHPRPLIGRSVNYSRRNANPISGSRRGGEHLQRSQFLLATTAR
jgi:hypothetical protein